MTPLADVAADVAAAKRGDQPAWDRLVRHFTPRVRAIARRHRLAHCDQDEVAQRTWLALLRNIDRIHEPAAIGGWLQTTAQRESLRVAAELHRAVPMAEVVLSDAEPDAFAEVIDERERRESLLRAARRVPTRQRALLEALLAEPALSYDEISAKLNMPIGSIGPTRARCLARLRRDPSITGLIGEMPPGRPSRTPRPLPDVL